MRPSLVPHGYGPMRMPSPQIPVAVEEYIHLVSEDLGIFKSDTGINQSDCPWPSTRWWARNTSVMNTLSIWIILTPGPHSTFLPHLLLSFPATSSDGINL